MLSSPLGALSVLAGIVLIHELGHYSSAKSFGIDVEEFSVGIGPKLLGFKAFGDEFSLRLLPLGGYVRFPEHYNATLMAELQAQAREEAKAERERQKQLQLQKELQLQQQQKFRERVFNILTLGTVERKRKQQQKEEAEAALAQAAQKGPWWQRNKKSEAGISSGGDGAEDDDDELEVPKVEIPYYDNPNLLQNRPWQQRFVVLSGGVVRIVIMQLTPGYGWNNLISLLLCTTRFSISSWPFPFTLDKSTLERVFRVRSLNPAWW